MWTSVNHETPGPRRSGRGIARSASSRRAPGFFGRASVLQCERASVDVGVLLGRPRSQIRPKGVLGASTPEVGPRCRGVPNLQSGPKHRPPRPPEGPALDADPRHNPRAHKSRITMEHGQVDAVAVSGWLSIGCLCGISPAATRPHRCKLLVH